MKKNILYVLLLFVAVSCGENEGVAPGVLDAANGGGSSTQYVSSTGGDTCTQIDVSAFQGCNVKNFKLTTIPSPPGAFATYVLPCGTCGACPFGTAINSSVACGCSTNGFIHFNLNEISAWSAFPTGVASPGLGHVISSASLSVYMSDLTASGVTGDLDLELDCP